MLQFPFYLIAEWICFIISVLLLNNLFAKFWLAVKFYLLAVVLLETFCYYLAWIARVNNQIYYNFFTPVEFTFGIWILAKIIASKQFNYVFLIGYLIFYFTFFLEWYSKKTFTIYLDKADTVGSVIVICLCILYYYKLFENEVYEDLIAEPSFWFVSGYFLFYATSIGVDTFFDQLVQIRIKNSISLRYIIMNILNLILYSCWIKSFVCLNIKQKYMLQ